MRIHVPPLLYYGWKKNNALPFIHHHHHPEHHVGYAVERRERQREGGRELS